MSHFGIDPIAAKKFWDDTPVHIDASTITRNHIAMCEKFHTDMLLHDAYFYGLFPPEDVSQDYLDAFAEIKDITRKYAVDFIQPKKMPDVGTIGHPEEPCLNELTRLMRGYWTHNDVPEWIAPTKFPMSELSIVAARPMTSSTIRPEVIEVYKSRRQNGTGMHVALEDTKDYVSKRFLDIMGNTTQTERRF